MRNGFLIYGEYASKRQNLHKLVELVHQLKKSLGLQLAPHRLEKDYEFLDLLFKKTPDFLIIAGGDGTLNYLCNYLLKRKLQIPVAIIPTGTCNDFARCHNLPQDPHQAAMLIGNNKRIRVDVGLINGNHYFLTACAGGLFAGVASKTSPRLKKRFGPLAYYINAFMEAVNVKPFTLKLTTDNGSYEDEAVLFAILNGRHIAGLSDIINNADMTDGKMDILIIKKCAPLDLAALFLKIFNRDIINDKKVRLLHASHIDIAHPGSHVSVTIDGEKAETDKIVVEVIPQCLEIFVP